MNAAPLRDRDRRQLAHRDLLAAGSRDEDVADRLGVSRYCGCEPHNEIEQLLALDDLRRRRPADRGLDQRVDVRDIDAVPGDLLAVDVDGQCRLAELLHERQRG